MSDNTSKLRQNNLRHSRLMSLRQILTTQKLDVTPYLSSKMPPAPKRIESVLAGFGSKVMGISSALVCAQLAQFRVFAPRTQFEYTLKRENAKPDQTDFARELSAQIDGIICAPELCAYILARLPQLCR